MVNAFTYHDHFEYKLMLNNNKPSNIKAEIMPVIPIVIIILFQSLIYPKITKFLGRKLIPKISPSRPILKRNAVFSSPFFSRFIMP